MTFDPSTDPVVNSLWPTINDGIKEINEANLILLAEETGTPVREIDKVLKAEFERVAKHNAANPTSPIESNLPTDVIEAYNESRAAYEKYRAAIDTARNIYRTKILGEEEKSVSGEVDQDALKEKRSVVMAGISFLETYAKSNGRSEIQEWVSTLEVPQVGRKGTSSVGTKKPRVNVTASFLEEVDGEMVSVEKTFESFSKYAAELSKVSGKGITAGDVAAAWQEANNSQEGEFTFEHNSVNYTLTVGFKNKASDSAA